MTLGEFKELTQDRSDDLELAIRWGVQKFEVWEVFKFEDALRIDLTLAEKTA